jgi:hypothetical protein
MFAEHMFAEHMFAEHMFAFWESSIIITIPSFSNKWNHYFLYFCAAESKSELLKQ